MNCSVLVLVYGQKLYTVVNEFCCLAVNVVWFVPAVGGWLCIVQCDDNTVLCDLVNCMFLNTRPLCLGTLCYTVQYFSDSV